jgi:hypothetical protein
VQVNAITTRGGKSTQDPPYPKGTGRTSTVLVVPEEKKDDEVEEVACNTPVLRMHLALQIIRMIHQCIHNHMWSRVHLESKHLCGT